jgi:cytochrome P450
MKVSYEAFSSEHHQDPYPIYRSLRDHAPVHRSDESGVWVLSRYDDVASAFKDPELFSSKVDNLKRLPGGGIANIIMNLRVLMKVITKLRVSPRRAANGRMLIQEDGDIHRAMRAIVNRGFTPGRIADWEPRIREIARDCMKDIRGQREFDFVRTLAIPLPVTVIAEILGIEPERRVEFKRWSDQIIQTTTNTGPDRLIDLTLIDVLGEMSAYLRPIIRKRRSHPKDDLISTLVEAQDGETALNDYEVFMFIFLLLLAGNETTTNLLGNAVDALLEHPDQLARVSNDLSLVPALIEETLRYDSPVQQLTRRVTREVTLHGVTLPPDSEVQLLIGSANRDERRFPDPDRLDLSRDTKGHLGFGFGAHFCLGASLARLEARISLEAMVPELSGLVRSRPELELLPSNVLRGRARLSLSRDFPINASTGAY